MAVTKIPQALTWQSAARTDQGCVRKVNEDAVLVAAERRVWCVADGMGGHDSGEVASQLITRTLQKFAGSPQLADALDELDDLLQAVNRALFQRASAAGKTMGATVVVAVARADLLGILWAGDSRAYLFREGRCHLLTADHTQLEALLALGEVRPEDAAEHPGAGIVTRAVGAAEQLTLDSEVIRAVAGDWVLLCSDGVGKHLADRELAGYFTGEDPSVVANRVIDSVLARGGKDNVSVVALLAHEASDTVTNPAR